MSYVIAAYGLTVAGIAGYALYLARERAALRRELAFGEESNPG
ncbi:MAG: heme exporter protein CcmD [bacterium]|nr:heme exporter protein CcmD [bacterium]